LRLAKEKKNTHQKVHSEKGREVLIGGTGDQGTLRRPKRGGGFGKEDHQKGTLLRNNGNRKKKVRGVIGPTAVSGDTKTGAFKKPKGALRKGGELGKV